MEGREAPRNCRAERTRAPREAWPPHRPRIVDGGGVAGGSVLGGTRRAPWRHRVAPWTHLCRRRGQALPTRYPVAARGLAQEAEARHRVNEGARVWVCEET